jgi:CDGSH-type Zn-finger protein
VAKVADDAGKFVDWEVYETLETDGEYWLCRCGESTTKPFCSGMHAKVDFDGTETAQTDAYMERAEVLGGTDVTVRDDRGICAHAAFCSSRVTNVWKASKTIDDDAELRQTVVEMINRCPSGALTYEVGGVPTEREMSPEIRVQKDGPYIIRGGINVKRADGQPLEIRYRMCLCRCGHSKNKPLCDGSHFEVGFTDG